MEHHGHSEQRHFPVSEGYDRSAVDAYLRDLAVEVETLTRVSGELHQRVQALGGELRALTASLRGVSRESSPAVSASPMAVAADQPVAPSAVAAPVGSSSAVYTQPASSAMPASPSGEQDLDGARLVALNMALEGQPRERTDAYLAERFQLNDRAQLLDEVYAAVEG